MVCQPCKDQYHWDCPDVIRANVVRTRGNPGKNTGRVPTGLNGWALNPATCDCQHEPLMLGTSGRA
jgi:hypothetical protein